MTRNAYCPTNEVVVPQWKLDLKAALQANAFCATGKGGGKDNSCSSSEGGGGAATKLAKSMAPIHKSVLQPGKEKIGPGQDLRAVAEGTYDRATADAKSRAARAKTVESKIKMVSETTKKMSFASGAADDHRTAANYHKIASALTDDGGKVRYHRMRVTAHEKKAAALSKMFSELNDQRIAEAKAARAAGKPVANFELDPFYRVPMIVEALLLNAFCPTGEGGGRDNSCSSKDGGGSVDREQVIAAMPKDSQKGVDSTSGKNRDFYVWTKPTPSKANSVGLPAGIQTAITKLTALGFTKTATNAGEGRDVYTHPDGHQFTHDRRGSSSQPGMRLTMNAFPTTTPQAQSGLKLPLLPASLREDAEGDELGGEETQDMVKVSRDELLAIKQAVDVALGDLAGPEGGLNPDEMQDDISMEDEAGEGPVGEDGLPIEGEEDEVPQDEVEGDVPADEQDPQMEASEGEEEPLLDPADAELEDDEDEDEDKPQW